MPRNMKAISLWQPWASAIVAGLKRVETRSWATSYRGPLIIHAAKKWTGDLRFAAEDLRNEFSDLPLALPLGCALGVCQLVDVRYMTKSYIGTVPPQERAFGDWYPGRYAWVLERVVAFDEPVPLKGRQGLWVPTDTELLSLKELDDA